MNFNNEFYLSYEEAFQLYKTKFEFDSLENTKIIYNNEYKEQIN